MNRTQAEQAISPYLRPIFGFALKRCRTVEDAEDLSQDILLRAFRALLAHDDIADIPRFVWTVAHHALANYYRDRAGSSVGVPLEELADLLPDPDASVERVEEDETLDRLRREIAYLSKLQRQIVIAYYFENRRQTAKTVAEIADALGVSPVYVEGEVETLTEPTDAQRRGLTTLLIP